MWQETTEQLASWQGRGALPTATHWLECVPGSGRQTLLQYALPGEIHPQKPRLLLKYSELSLCFYSMEVGQEKNQMQSVHLSCWRHLHCASSQHHFCRFRGGFACTEAPITRNCTDKADAGERCLQLGCKTLLGGIKILHSNKFAGMWPCNLFTLALLDTSCL